MEKQLIAKVDEVKDGSAKDFTYQNHPAILVHYEGELHAYVNVCTHEGGNCILQGDVLWCTWHGATFDPKTGKALSEPAPLDSALKRIPISIENEEIFAT